MRQARHIPKSTTRNLRSYWLIPAVLGILAAACPSSAQAQISPFRGYKGPTLSKEDLAAGHAAAEKLLVEDKAEIDRSEHWIGPKSGNEGNITVEKAFTRQGMPCRTLRSEIHYKQKSAPPRSFNLNACQLKSGQWKTL